MGWQRFRHYLLFQLFLYCFGANETCHVVVKHSNKQHSDSMLMNTRLLLSVRIKKCFSVHRGGQSGRPLGAYFLRFRISSTVTAPMPEMPSRASHSAAWLLSPVCGTSGMGFFSLCISTSVTAPS